MKLVARPIYHHHHHNWNILMAALYVEEKKTVTHTPRIGNEEFRAGS